MLDLTVQVTNDEAHLDDRVSLQSAKCMVEHFVEECCPCVPPHRRSVVVLSREPVDVRRGTEAMSSTVLDEVMKGSLFVVHVEEDVFEDTRVHERGFEFIEISVALHLSYRQNTRRDRILIALSSSQG